MVWPFGKKSNPYATGKGEPPPVSTLPPQGPPDPSREAAIRERIVAMAEDTFPDNVGQEWPILGFEHRGHLTFVEVEPKPATVGYPRFKFVVPAGGEPRAVATYCLEGGRYVLLCTEHGLKEDLPKVLS